jgi:hypothetical protein
VHICKFSPLADGTPTGRAYLAHKLVQSGAMALQVLKRSPRELSQQLCSDE